MGWCIASDGRKHLLHLAVGNKESQACWTEFFRSLLGRGMRAPTTVTSDGAPGLINAITACFPASIRIRCWFHRLGNLRAKLPDETAGEVLAHAYAVRDAPTLDAARAAADRLVNTYRREYPAAVACFADDLEALLAIHRVPVRHRIRVRTTNLAERSFVEERRRTKVIPRFPDESRHEAGVRHHDPRRRPLVPGVDQRPRTPPTHPAAALNWALTRLQQHRSPQNQPTQRHHRMINRPRRRCGRPGDKWHLDEVFITINGKRQYLWQAVDQAGTVLDILVTSRRDGKAATRFFRKLLNRLAYAPRVLVTDKLASYGVARRRLIPGVEHRQSKYLNNRAENSHQPARQQERAMRSFRSPGGEQRFLSAFSGISPRFRPRRHLLSAQEYRREMDTRFLTWNEVIALPTVA